MLAVKCAEIGVVSDGLNARHTSLRFFGKSAFRRLYVREETCPNARALGRDEDYEPELARSDNLIRRNVQQSKQTVAA
jgi:hypothetical protein